ncbi:hypothetical protein DFR55_12814 [Herbinix hemicellulosilytica]|mgnify:CR=1 FL=1|uniref:Uncharacterized protein n=1 Tax=Herbinix hemicellulosilytica TaxID=1564487 RepID=A0A0H5SV63_HERHM|nr:hypothetical protein [Herbinix hemicellulosilytica]RBP57134.1 hypothetical protein DFR55_12814 [Herbinix hemicellulosilytica]CRZ34213.1 hypothetical protein HHT355_1010 [Herbinix hemicellulosilytica]
MIFVFGVLLVISFMREKDKILNKKVNFLVFLFLSFIGIMLGIIHQIYPYVPSMASVLEKYIK